LLLQNRDRIYAKFRTHLRCFSSWFTLESARARTRTTYCMIYAVKYMSLCSRKCCPQCHIHSTCFGRQKIPLYMVYASLSTYICIRILHYAIIVLDFWLLTAWLRGCWVDRVLAGASISRGSPGLPLPLPYIYSHSAQQTVGPFAPFFARLNNDDTRSRSNVHHRTLSNIKGHKF
jgi:hypothetical protein